jgi:hypothetical protein
LQAGKEEMWSCNGKWRATVPAAKINKGVNKVKQNKTNKPKENKIKTKQKLNKNNNNK